MSHSFIHDVSVAICAAVAVLLWRLASVVQSSQSDCSTSRSISFRVDWPLSRVSVAPWQESLPSIYRHSCTSLRDSLGRLENIWLPTLSPSSYTLDRRLTHLIIPACAHGDFFSSPEERILVAIAHEGCPFRIYMFICARHPLRVRILLPPYAACAQ